MLRRKLCWAALAAFSLLGQTPGAPQLVRLYPAVFDASGQPVTDLTAKDFEIVDNGKPQAALFFRKPDAAPEVSSPSEFANRKNGRIGNTVVILFDLINLNPGSRTETWHAVARSLPELESGDSVYFYMIDLTGELVPIHAIGPKSADDATWPRDVEPVLDKAMKNAGHGKQVQMGQEDRVKKTFHQLEVVAAMLAALPGRRNVLWITDGMQNVYHPKIPCKGDWVDCGIYVPHLAVALARSSVAVNVVSYNKDLSAAARADPGSWEDKWTPARIANAEVPMQEIGDQLAIAAHGGTPARNGAVNKTGAGSPNASLDLAEMALLTGGGIYFRQGIREAIQSIFTRDAAAFEIAYDPSAANWDNKFHRVRIACKRKGVVVQTRARYYALPDSRPAADRVRAALIQALQSPADNPDIGLWARSSPPPHGKGGVHLNIRVDLSDILLREEDGKFKGSLYLLISDRGAAGPVGEPVVLNLNPELTDEQYERAMKEGLPLAQDHPVTDSVRAVRVIVLDQSTNIAGSVTIPLV
jgi:VWFA-related protein